MMDFTQDVQRMGGLPTILERLEGRDPALLTRAMAWRGAWAPVTLCRLIFATSRDDCTHIALEGSPIHDTIEPRHVRHLLESASGAVGEILMREMVQPERQKAYASMVKWWVSDFGDTERARVLAHLCAMSRVLTEFRLLDLAPETVAKACLRLASAWGEAPPSPAAPGRSPVLIPESSPDPAF
jgi:hypothetical protein